MHMKIEIERMKGITDSYHGDHLHPHHLIPKTLHKCNQTLLT